MWTNILRALGQPLIMTPLSTTAYEGIEASEVGSASGLYNMMRNLGGSIGIGTLGSLLTQRYQFHFSRIAESVSQVDVEAQNRIAQLTHSYVQKGYDLVTAHGQAIQTLGAIFNREANVMAYGDCFYFMAATLFIGAMMTVVMKKSSGANAPAGDH
jgi:DHA2 family multidrug resistance protein